MKQFNQMIENLTAASSKVSTNAEFVPQAREIMNTAGRVISAHRMLIEYRKARGEKPESPFIDDK